MSWTLDTWTVDGVALNTTARMLELPEGVDTTAGLRGDNLTVPGRHGRVWRPKRYDEANRVLRMWATGNDEATLEANLDALIAMFTVRHRLLDVRRTRADGVTRQMFAEAVDVLDPRILLAYPYNGYLELNVALRTPGAFWQDVATSDFTSPAGLTLPSTVAVTTLAGGTAPIDDAVIVVRGPIANPTVTDVSGASVTLAGTLANGTDWQVDSSAWTSKTGAALGFGAGGTDALAATTHTDARMLPITPAGASSPQLTLSGTGGVGAATALLVRGRRKFLR